MVDKYYLDYSALENGNFSPQIGNMITQHIEYYTNSIMEQSRQIYMYGDYIKNDCNKLIFIIDSLIRYGVLKDTRKSKIDNILKE